MCSKTPFCIAFCAKIWYSIAILAVFGLASMYFWEMRDTMLRLEPKNFDNISTLTAWPTTKVMYLSQTLSFPVPQQIYGTTNNNSRLNCISDKYYNGAQPCYKFRQGQLAYLIVNFDINQASAKYYRADYATRSFFTKNQSNKSEWEKFLDFTSQQSLIVAIVFACVGAICLLCIIFCCSGCCTCCCCSKRRGGYEVVSINGYV